MTTETPKPQDPRERAFALMMKNRPQRKKSHRLRRGAAGAVGKLRRELSAGEGCGGAPNGEGGVGGGADSAQFEARCAEIEAERERLAKENALLKEALLRSKADLENFRKRAARERQQVKAFAIEDVLKELVPVVDNFDLALAYGADADEKSLRGVVDGVKMIAKQLFDTLAARGVTKINETGVEFDPQRHEAVAMVPPEEGQADNIVVDVVQSGYLLSDRVVRAAKVRITKTGA